MGDDYFQNPFLSSSFIGKRIKLSYTRALVQAVLKGDLGNLPFRKESYFGLDIPVFSVGKVPMDILDPKNNWEDKEAYDTTAKKLLMAFEKNYADMKVV